MNDYINIIMIFSIAFVVSFFMTPIIKKLAIRINAIDIPKDGRRVHNKPIPRLGGLAILTGFLIALTFYFIMSGISTSVLFNKQILGLLLGIIIIEIAGVWDDIKPIRAWTKLLFQIVAAAVVVGFGVRIEGLTVPFVEDQFLGLGILSIPLSMIWIIGLTNAINFIDGLDGLADGVATISSIALLFIAIYLEDPLTIALATGLAGSTLGFLPFNFNPAKIFMGETGSAFLGFTLGSLSIMGLVKSITIITIGVPLIVLGLPIFDTAFAIIRRLLSGKSPMQADRGHLHHRLIDSGLSQKQSVIILYVFSALLGLAGIFLIETEIWKFTLLILTIVIFIIAGSRYMGEMNNAEKGDCENGKN